MGKFNQWCKKRTLSQKKKISFLLWLFLVTLPYQIFQLQTYVASWELYWNTEAPYRIGAVVSKKELEEKFIPREMSIDEFVKIVRESGYKGDLSQYSNLDIETE